MIMTPELTALALAGLLQAIQFVLFAVPATRQLGTPYTMGPRDKPVDIPVNVGRLQRAMNNHFEGLILFTIAVVVVTLGGQSSALTATCGWIYLVARVLYIPAYVFGLRPWRSVVWVVGFSATILMILAAIF